MQEPQSSSVIPAVIVKSRRKLILPLAIVSFGLLPLGIIANLFFPYFAFNGVLILVVVLTFLVAPILGISAVRLANRDLRGIRDGAIPASAQGVTTVGRTLGMSAAVGDALVLFVFVLQLFSFDGIAPGKDSLTNDLNNLCANAYQYRVRPVSMGGGGSSYTGYSIPARLSVNQTGTYSVLVVHPDTIQFTARLLADSTSSVTAKFGPDGQSIEPWAYTGTFQK